MFDFISGASTISFMQYKTLSNKEMMFQVLSGPCVSILLILFTGVSVGSLFFGGAILVLYPLIFFIRNPLVGYTPMVVLYKDFISRKWRENDYRYKSSLLLLLVIHAAGIVSVTCSLIIRSVSR
jgi:uncharacterized membrane protein YfcA